TRSYGDWSSDVCFFRSCPFVSVVDRRRGHRIVVVPRALSGRPRPWTELDLQAGAAPDLERTARVVRRLRLGRFLNVALLWLETEIGRASCRGAGAATEV